MGAAQRLFTRLRTRLQRSGKQRSWLLRLVISAFLLGAVALWVNPASIIAEVQGFSAGWVVLALAISTLQIMLSAWRWQFTAGLIEVPLRFGYALREYYLALLVNQLLPGGVLGDAGRAHRHASQAQSRGRAWRAVIIERASGQIAVAILTLIALLCSPLWHSALGGAWLVAIGVAVAAGLVAAGSVAKHQGSTRWLAQRPQWFQALAFDVKRSLLRRRAWPRQLVSSLAIVVSYGLVMVCAARAIGVELPALQVLALTPVLLLAMLVPLSVAGWGLREGAAAGVWSLVGLPAAQGVAVSLAYGVLVLLASVPGVWVALSRRKNAQPSGGGLPQSHVEQGVVATAEGSRRQTQRTVERVDGRHLQPGPAGADQQRGDQQMQSVNRPRFDKLRNGDAAPFHQYTGQAFLGQQANDIAGAELATCIQGQHAALNVGQAVGRRHLRPHDVQRGCDSGVQQRQIVRYAPPRVEDYAGRVVTANVAYRQLGVVGAGRASAHYHGVNQRTQAV